MKRRLSVLISCLLTLSTISVLPSIAMDDESLRIRMAQFKNDAYALDTDTFHYATGYWGMTVNSDLLDLNNGSVFMVSGLIFENDSLSTVCFTSITEDNDDYNGGRYIMFHPEELDFHSLQIGDIICAQSVGVMDTSPAQISIGQAEVIGAGEDIFGKEFRKVIRHEFLSINDVVTTDDPETAAFDFLRGDITEDDEVDIVDVISLNKYLLGARTVTCYQALTADVDKNGTLDETDSLMLLKEVVGITTNFEEQ